MTEEFSSPFIEERLYLDKELERYLIKEAQFSSPFIEERLYLKRKHENDTRRNESSRPLLSRSGCILIEKIIDEKSINVLVPFYRGAVVFDRTSGTNRTSGRFSSPFIEERLYFVRH